MNIGVIAGTIFDTQLGVDFLKNRGYDAEAYPISNTPQEQSILQILYPRKLEKMVIHRIHEIKSQGMKNIFVYCNSLSGAVDMDKLSLDFQVNIITPLQIYSQLGKSYKRIGVLAANNQSTFAIEKIIQKSNSDAYVVGIGLLLLVDAIEKKMNPKTIVKEFALEKLLDFFSTIGCEGIILGCTHFPYIYKALRELSTLPIIDPALKMLEKIQID